MTIKECVIVSLKNKKKYTYKYVISTKKLIFRIRFCSVDKHPLAPELVNIKFLATIYNDKLRCLVNIENVAVNYCLFLYGVSSYTNCFL